MSYFLDHVVYTGRLSLTRLEIAGFVRIYDLVLYRNFSDPSTNVGDDLSLVLHACLTNAHTQKLIIDFPPPHALCIYYR